MPRSHPALDHPPHLRASDADRERMADFLKGHCAQGRLSADELSDRLEAVYGGRTLGDLAAVASDLPAGPGATGRPHRRDRRSGPLRPALLALAVVCAVLGAGHALATAAVLAGVVLAARRRRQGRRVSLAFALVFAVGPIVALVAGAAWIVRALSERLRVPVHRLP